MIVKTTSQLELALTWKKESEAPGLKPEAQRETVVKIEKKLLQGEVKLIDLVKNDTLVKWVRTDHSTRVRWRSQQNETLYILFISRGQWTLMELNDALGLKEYYPFSTYEAARDYMLARIQSHDDGLPLTEELLAKLPKITVAIAKDFHLKPIVITRKLGLEPNLGNITKIVRMINSTNLWWISGLKDGAGWMSGGEAFCDPKDVAKLSSGRES